MRGKEEGGGHPVGQGTQNECKPKNHPQQSVGLFVGWN